MENLPTDWLSLLILTFVLGMKHGFDADHLATIDGLTRYNARRNPRLARYCGTLFSFGHGAVVMAIALGVSAIAGRWAVPAWFGLLGSVISIAFLIALGSLNLAAVLRAGPDEMVQPVGLKGRWLGNFRQISNPALIVLVGALFALSFDTLSQAAFFALTATQFGVLISAFFWTYTPGQVLAGWLGERLNPYRTLALGLAFLRLFGYAEKAPEHRVFHHRPEGVLHIDLAGGRDVDDGGHRLAQHRRE